ncbi:MAG: NADPH:quinone oxidoreductase [Ilumatobacteraceae bacterium]|nr:NADPH:quinone oxidoreductase [Ilumatobacteraceae bacterium]
MKAALVRELGSVDDIEVAEVADPVAGRGQVVIDVAACAVNFPDVLMVRGQYQERPELPFVAGQEVAGVVSAIGEGVTEVQIGDRVIGSVGVGGFAEKAVARESSVYPLPDGVDMVHGAAFMTTYGTSWHALAERAAIRPGETLLVLGAGGGVGLAAVDIGRALGARVLAAASSPEKLALAKQYGAEQGIDYSVDDLREGIKAFTGGRGVDVVYDPVGGALSEQALRSTAWEGRFLVVGFAAGDIPKVPLNLALLKGCSIVGVFLGSRAARDPAAHRASMLTLIDRWRQGQLNPHVSRTFDLDHVPAALHVLADREALGKVVVTTS